MSNVLLNKRCAVVTKFASKDKTQPKLTMVHVTPTQAMATDSYRAARVTLPEMNAESFPTNGAELYDVPDKGINIPATSIDAAIKNLPKTYSLPILGTVALTDVDPDRVGLMTNDLTAANTIETRLVDQEYPDLDHIWPKDDAEPVIRIAFNPSFLKSVAEAAEKFQQYDAPIVCSFYSPIKPAMFEITSDEQTLEMILMPVSLA